MARCLPDIWQLPARSDPPQQTANCKRRADLRGSSMARWSRRQFVPLPPREPKRGPCMPRFFLPGVSSGSGAAATDPPVRVDRACSLRDRAG